MTSAAPRRVAITGLGALSPGGIGVAAYRQWFAAHGGAGEGQRIPDFRASDFVRSPKLLRSMHRSFQLVAAAAVLAMRYAGLPNAESLLPAGIRPERAGIAAALADLSPLTPDLLRALAQTPTPGEAAGEAASYWARFAEVSLHQLHPFRRLTLLANMAAAHTSLLFGLQGPSFTFTSGAAAGAQTLAQAYWTITHDRADLMLCMAADSPEQSFSSRPAAELAGAVVFESFESAASRRATILAEVVLGPTCRRQAFFTLATSSCGSPVPSLMAALLRFHHLCQPAPAPPPQITLSALLSRQDAAA